jgi:hypothetical protein
VKRGSVVHIVGNDCANLSGSYTHWMKLLEAWISRGCTIRYLVRSLSTESLQLLSSLASKRGKNGGRLEVFKIKDLRKARPDMRALLNKWRTFHFVVFENPRQLWIETSHQPGNTYAEDCFFHPKCVAKHLGLIDVYKAQLDLVLRRHGEKVCLS